MTLRQRQPRRRNKEWLGAVASLESCVRCKKWGIQVAHRDQGKGMGMKTDDHMTAALCPECHRELGEGKHMTREERRNAMNEALVDTFDALVRAGIVGLV